MFRILTNNWPLKLLALFLAFVLSVYVYQYGEYEMKASLDLPLEVRNLSDDLTFLDLPPPKIKVNVSGNLQQVNALKREAIRAVIDLKSFTAAGSYTISPELPDTPLLKVYCPLPVVRARLAKKLRIRLPIEAWHRGDLPGGYLLSRESIAPRQAEVVGPEELVLSARRVIAEVNLAGRLSRISQSIPLVAYTRENAPLDPAIVRIEPSSAQYSAEVNPVANVKAVRINAELSGSPPAGYYLKEMRITPSQVLFPEALYKQRPLKTLSIEPVSLDGKKGSFSQTAKILYGFIPPSDLPTTVTIEVTLGKLDASEDTMVTVNIDIFGRNPDYDYIVHPPSVIVQSADFAGFSEAERSIVKVQVNVEGLTLGIYRIAPQVNLPPNIRGAIAIPETIEVSVIQR